MSKLLEKMKKASAKRVDSHTMDNTDFADPKHVAPCHQNILSFLYSGKIRGPGAGIPPGLHMLAGQSKSGKTQLALNAVKDYLDFYPDAICIFYDTEFGGGHSWEKMGIDTSRVIHVPIMDVEAWKFDFMQKFKEITRGDRIIFMVDSLGMMGSKKETDDAENESSKADMSRAKAIASALRLITPRLSYYNCPMVCINHTGKTLELFSKEIMTGGQKATLAPNTIVFFAKSKIINDKDENAIDYGQVGFTFKLKINKSRILKEGAVLEMPWKYGQSRPWKYTGMWNMAESLGVIFSPSKGWRALKLFDPETGEETNSDNFREMDVKWTEEFYDRLFDETRFIELAEKKYQL